MKSWFYLSGFFIFSGEGGGTVVTLTLKSETVKMSPVSPVFHTIVTVSIGLNTQSRVGTSIPYYFLCFSFPLLAYHAH